MFRKIQITHKKQIITQNQLLPHIFTITPSATQYTAKHKAQGPNTVFRISGYQSMDADPKRGIDKKRNERPFDKADFKREYGRIT